MERQNVHVIVCGEDRICRCKDPGWQDPIPQRKVPRSGSAMRESGGHLLELRGPPLGAVGAHIEIVGSRSDHILKEGVDLDKSNVPYPSIRGVFSVELAQSFSGNFVVKRAPVGLVLGLVTIWEVAAKIRLRDKTVLPVGWSGQCLCLGKDMGRCSSGAFVLLLHNWLNEHDDFVFDFQILEMDTYRYHGHSMSDPGSTYRSRDEITGVRQERDPIERVRKLLLAHDIATADELKDIEKQARKEVDDVIAQAKESPHPDPSELFTNVYVKGYGVEVFGADRKEVRSVLP